MTLPYPSGEPLSCQQIRELDILAIEHVGIPGVILMENAARTVAEFVYAALIHPAKERVVVLCGSGNNGGDGLVAARHLVNAGVAVTVVLGLAPSRSTGDAGINLAIYQRMAGPLIDASTDDGLARARAELEGADVIVDALLGTGAAGQPRGRVAELIRLANAARRARRIAVDIPSGLNADTGEVGEPCFEADATVTFVACKLGFAAVGARRVLGRVVVADIGAPRHLIPGRGGVSGEGPALMREGQEKTEGRGG